MKHTRKTTEKITFNINGGTEGFSKDLREIIILGLRADGISVPDGANFFLREIEGRDSWEKNHQELEISWED